jgi:AbrB family looped-hinge helix DNA binding protein
MGIARWYLPFYNGIMPSKLSMDHAGRVVLPKPVRDQLHLEPGESLEIETFQDHIILRPVRGSSPMRKKEGIWVFRTGEPLAASVVEATARKVREEREKEVSGPTK